VERVQSLPLPEDALLARYRDIGAYTDCFTIEVDTCVSQVEYVCAFYTSPLFKMERFILKWVVSKPSTDADVSALALAKTDAFAAWTVEDRRNNQLLLCDYQKRTRSWLMALPLSGGTRTRLYFGSAVSRLRPDGREDRAFGLAFTLLVGVHKLYARGLLSAAVRHLNQRTN
jgi:hypothetical protein